MVRKVVKKATMEVADEDEREWVLDMVGAHGENRDWGDIAGHYNEQFRSAKTAMQMRAFYLYALGMSME